LYGLRGAAFTSRLSRRLYIVVSVELVRYDPSLWDGTNELDRGGIVGQFVEQ
jgi:hypothetical protein